MAEPRAYTEDEIRDMLIDHVRRMARYWAELPDARTVQERCDGVAFSILTCLDGGTMSLPAFDLVARPHEDDKEFLRSEGVNWIEPGTTISTMLHEHYYPARGRHDG